MNPETREVLRAAEEAVARLVEQCGKAGPQYGQKLTPRQKSEEPSCPSRP